MEDIPEPQDSGSAGRQEAIRGDVLPPHADIPTAGLPFVDAIQGLAAANPRRMGGETPAALLSGYVSQAYYDLGAIKQEFQQTKAQLEGTREKLAECKIRVGVLTERIRSHHRMRHFKNVCIAFGSVLMTVGIELKDIIDIYSYLVVVLGLLLVILGWLVIGGETEE